MGLVFTVCTATLPTREVMAGEHEVGRVHQLEAAITTVCAHCS